MGKAGVSRYYYGLKFVKENVSKQVEKWSKNVRVYYYREIFRENTILLSSYSPSLKNLSYGASWPRLLLEVWSCGRVVGNGTEETVIPNGVLTVQMVGFFSCSLLLGEFSSSLFIISLGHSLLGGVVLCLSMMLVS